MSLSHLEQILECICRSKCAYRSLHMDFAWDQPNVWFVSKSIDIETWHLVLTRVYRHAGSCLIDMLVRV